jgi:hypothetical protein
MFGERDSSPAKLLSATLLLYCVFSFRKVPMSRHALLTLIVSLQLVAYLTLGCGSPAAHQVQSISLSPASADAQNYPDGKVPFIASGSYNTAPMTITPLQANWAATSEQLVNGTLTFGPVSSAVSIDHAGVAQCTPSASGTYAVVAWDIQNPSLTISCESKTDFGEPGCNAVQGTAQLTCP